MVHYQSTIYPPTHRNSPPSIHPMCTTHTSNTKAKSKPTCPSAEDSTEPIKKQTQQGLLIDGGSIAPLNNGPEFTVEAAPKAKGRGHKQATAPSLEGAKGSNKDKQPSTNAAPRKHGRKPASDNQSEVEDAPVKQAKSVVQTVDDLPAKPKKATLTSNPKTSPNTLHYPTDLFKMSILLVSQPLTRPLRWLPLNMKPSDRHLRQRFLRVNKKNSCLPKWM